MAEDLGELSNDLETLVAEPVEDDGDAPETNADESDQQDEGEESPVETPDEEEASENVEAEPDAKRTQHSADPVIDSVLAKFSK